MEREQGRCQISDPSFVGLPNTALFNPNSVGHCAADTVGVALCFSWCSSSSSLNQLSEHRLHDRDAQNTKHKTKQKKKQAVLNLLHVGRPASREEMKKSACQVFSSKS
jgi:hypothetical protein